MGVQRWTVALDGYLIPIGGGREREVYDDGEQVVLAADHDRIVAEAEARGWNAAVEAAIKAVAGVYPVSDPWGHHTLPHIDRRAARAAIYRLINAATTGDTDD